MALTTEQIQANEDTFISLISTIDREGFQKDKLIHKLKNSDFFVAPASTKYHCNYAGGLCEHSINVYYNIVTLISTKKNLDDACYDENTQKIVTLLHDISKMNIYEEYFANKKVYCENGSKYDNNGKFDWISEAAWKYRDNKFVFGNHEMTAEFIARQFIPLTIDESVAILHHMGGLSTDSAKDNISEVYTQYPLALMLHLADMISTFVDESRGE